MGAFGREDAQHGSGRLASHLAFSASRFSREERRGSFGRKILPVSYQ
jgi:hypothetical protein